MHLTKCMANDCSNLTVKNFEEYGTFCFLHCFMTKKPKTLSDRVSKNFSAPLASRDILLPTEPLSKPIIVETVQNEKLVPSPIRRAPLPSLKKTIHYGCKDTIKCCICEDIKCDDDKMECGHMVCNECLDYVRSLKCPVCRKDMKGNLIVDEVIKDIRKRESEDMRERELEDMNAAEMVALGYNANDFYE